MEGSRGRTNPPFGIDRELCSGLCSQAAQRDPSSWISSWRLPIPNANGPCLACRRCGACAWCRNSTYPRHLVVLGRLAARLYVWCVSYRGLSGVLAALEERVPRDHPRQRIKEVAAAALERLSPEFDRMYARVGRASAPPERLPRRRC